MSPTDSSVSFNMSAHPPWCPGHSVKFVFPPLLPTLSLSFAMLVPHNHKTSSHLLLGTLIPSQVAPRWETLESRHISRSLEILCSWRTHHHCKLSVSRSCPANALYFLLISSSCLKQTFQKRSILFY